MVLTYSQLVILLIVAIAANLWLRPKEEAIRTLIAFAITFPLAVPLYLLLPVCGPSFAFSSFPVEPTTPPSLHPILLDAAPNGFPSIHMATAMLIFWYLRRWRWGLIVGAMFMVLTALATMAIGQHYFLDLVFAVPYAIAMVRLVSWTPRATKAYDSPPPAKGAAIVIEKL
jgi:membrane-associated phospholipid phosphatase